MMVVCLLFWDVLGGFWGRKHQKKVLVGRKQLLSLDSVCVHVYLK